MQKQSQIVSIHGSQYRRSAYVAGSEVHYVEYELLPGRNECDANRIARRSVSGLFASLVVMLCGMLR